MVISIPSQKLPEKTDFFKSVLVVVLVRYLKIINTEGSREIQGTTKKNLYVIANWIILSQAAI